MITGLPECQGYNAILMVCCMKSKDYIPIPCTKELTAEGYANLLPIQTAAKVEQFDDAPIRWTNFSPFEPQPIDLTKLDLSLTHPTDRGSESPTEQAQHTPRAEAGAEPNRKHGLETGEPESGRPVVKRQKTLDGLFGQPEGSVLGADASTEERLLYALASAQCNPQLHLQQEHRGTHDNAGSAYPEFLCSPFGLDSLLSICQNS
ncbi:hypothetical protein NUW54_g13702 [Trametes sanguinea]|uniref:Uncharacterized protein n=1 Tax=Trametes sanguinea TaxID=158606 RepID=A0ACC1MKP5_9APHY|nr:hypothetical protein NUW54_g13702 [Trametes sanguinea]